MTTETNRFCVLDKAPSEELDHWEAQKGALTSRLKFDALTTQLQSPPETRPLEIKEA